MSEQLMKGLREKMETLLTLQRAPSQFAVLFHLLGTGKTMTVKEIASELNLTPKATERATAKLLEKGLIQRAAFRDGAYTCDNKQIVLAMLLAISDISERLELQVKRETREVEPTSS